MKINKKTISSIDKSLKQIIPKSFHKYFTPFKKSLLKFSSFKKLTGIWFITWQCNFKCPYCWQWEEPKVYRKKYNISAKDWLIGWEKLSNQFDEIVLGISGGEPFAVDGFIEMLNDFPDNIKYDITSNLSFNCDEFLSYDKILRNCSGVVCSFHPSNPSNSDNYINEFFKKVNKLSILPNTRVNFVAAPPNLKYYPIIKDFCEKHKIPLHVDRYVPLKRGGLEFTEQERKLAESIFSENRKMQNINKKTHKVLCSAGEFHIVVFPDGNVWPCLKKAELKEDMVGNLFSANFKLNEKWLECSYYPLCAGCDFDNVKIKKLSDQND